MSRFNCEMSWLLLNIDSEILRFGPERLRGGCTGGRYYVHIYIYIFVSLYIYICINRFLRIPDASYKYALSQIALSSVLGPSEVPKVWSQVVKQQCSQVVILWPGS